MKVRIVEVSEGKRKYYKLQEYHLWTWWDQTEPENGMLWPTFETLKEAEDLVDSMYNVRERVVREYEYR